MSIPLFVIFFLTILNIIIYIKYSHILTCEGVEELCSSSKKDTNTYTQKKVKVLDTDLSLEIIESKYSGSQVKDIYNLCNQILEYDKTVKKEDKLQGSIVISIDKIIKFYKEKKFSDFDSILSSLKFILKSVYISNPHLIHLRMII
jgi:helix-turn-helix protein